MLRLTACLILVMGASAALAADLPPFKLGIMSQVVSTSIELTPRDGGQRLEFRPAQSNYFGVSAGYKWLGGTLAFAVPSSREIRDAEGTSQYQDYRLTGYFKQFGVEISYNWFKGYLLENSSLLSASTLAGQSFYKIPDLVSRGYGANFLWVFDPAKYSLPAAVEMSQIQDKSGGSWVGLASLRQQNVESGAAWIPSELRAPYGTDSTVRAVRTGSYGVGGGYGYCWVPGRFVVAPLLAVTVGYQNIGYDLDSGARSNSSASLNVHARATVGYNSRRFFVGLSAYTDVYSKETETLRVSNNVMGLNFLLGTRF